MLPRAEEIHSESFIQNIASAVRYNMHCVLTPLHRVDSAERSTGSKVHEKKSTFDSRAALVNNRKDQKHDRHLRKTVSIIIGLKSQCVLKGYPNFDASVLRTS